MPRHKSYVRFDIFVQLFFKETTNNLLETVAPFIRPPLTQIAAGVHRRVRTQRDTGPLSCISNLSVLDLRRTEPKVHPQM